METYFVTGTDSYRKTACVHTIKNKNKQLDMKVLRSDDDFIEYIEEESIFNPTNKLLVVLDAEKIKPDEHMKAALECDRPHVVIFHASSDQRNKKLESVSGMKVMEFNGLKTYENNNEFKPWVNRLIRANGLLFSPEANDLFCRYVTPDLHSVQSELEKIKYYKPDDTITTDDIKLLIECRSTLGMWDPVMSLFGSDKDTAVRQLLQLLEEDSAPAVLAGMYNLVFKLSMLSDMLSKKESLDNISKTLGIPKFLLSLNWVGISEKTSTEKIVKVLHHMCTADNMLTTSAVPPNDVMVQLFKSISDTT